MKEQLENYSNLILNIKDDKELIFTCVDMVEFAKQYAAEQLRLHDVGCSLISEEELSVMANDYIELNCDKYDGFDKKAQRFQDYRNGLKNMYIVLK